MGIIGNIATGLAASAAGNLIGNSGTGSISSSASKLFGSNLINNLVSISSGGNDYIQFPNDLLSRNDVTQYTVFKCADRSQVTWGGRKKKTNLGIIYLPLPRDLVSEYKSDWGGVEGGTGALISKAAASAIDNIVGDGNNDIMKGSLEAAEYFGKKKVYELAEGAGLRAGAENTLGHILNPMNLLNWKSPDFRSFTFVWDLVPSSGKEAEVLNQIIYWMKRFIHTPSGPTDTTLKYPPLWDINFVDNTGLNPDAGGNKFLFKMKECAITSISVDYNSNGNSYHRRGIDGSGFQAPNGVKLTIGLTETKILTQHDFNTGYSDKSTP